MAERVTGTADSYRHFLVSFILQIAAQSLNYSKQAPLTASRGRGAHRHTDGGCSFPLCVAYPDSQVCLTGQVVQFVKQAEGSEVEGTRCAHCGCWCTDPLILGSSGQRMPRTGTSQPALATSPVYRTYRFELFVVSPTGSAKMTLEAPKDQRHCWGGFPAACLTLGTMGLPRRAARRFCAQQ